MARVFATIALLCFLWPVPQTPAEDVSGAPKVAPDDIERTVNRAIGYLQSESASWLGARKCAACHHAPLPIWALSEAASQGYAIDNRYLSETVESLLGSKDNLLNSRVFPNPADPPDPRPQGRGLNMGLPLLAVAAKSLPTLSENQKQSLGLIAEEIVSKQQADGSWEFFDTLRRPPINENQVTDTAWILMALDDLSRIQSSDATQTSLAKGTAWLDAAPSSNVHQDTTLRLLFALRRDQPPFDLQTKIDELLALQRPDGGWSQTIPEFKSDAFATGQTLYTLSLAGVPSDHLAIRRGISFLVATQTEIGNWPMDSRSTPDGSEGSAKLLTPIECAASAWATLGLARTSPKKHPSARKS